LDGFAKPGKFKLRKAASCVENYEHGATFKMTGYDFTFCPYNSNNDVDSYLYVPSIYSRELRQFSCNIIINGSGIWNGRFAAGADRIAVVDI